MRKLILAGVLAAAAALPFAALARARAQGGRS